MYCLLKLAPLFLAVAVCNGWLFGDLLENRKSRMNSLSGRYRRNFSRPPSLLNSVRPAFRSSTRNSPPPDRAAVSSRMRFRRYFEYIFGDLKKPEKSRKKVYDSDLVELQVWVTSADPECDGFPSLQTDESYELSIDEPSAVLKAANVWGALRGLETFSQLVYEDYYGVNNINKTDISDFPRFAHRGILLDSSRHFLPLKVILANLEAMAMNKFNVFHWHIVDDQVVSLHEPYLPRVKSEGSLSPIYTCVHSI